jgi:CheY-like chemotaxis protein
MATTCIFGTAGRVAIVLPQLSDFEAMVHALSAFKYKDIAHFMSPRDLMNSNRLAQFDWIICSSFLNQSFNVIDMLSSIRSGDVNPYVKVSVLIKRPDENEVLSKAFGQGLMSFHAAKFEHMDLLTELGELNQLYAKYRGVLPLVAAHYARIYLNETGKYKTRLHLEESLAKHISFHPDVLFHLAEAEFVHGKRAEAVRHLSQAAVLAPEYARSATLMQNRFLSPQDCEDLNQKIREHNILGFKKVLIVDHDSSVTQMILQSLNQSGIKDVASCNNGVEAVTWLKDHGPVDLLITEWKLPGKISGTALVQRMRQRGFGQLKIMVISSLLRKADELVLGEVGVDAVLPKPFTQSSFLECLVSLKINETLKSTSQITLKRIQALLSSGNSEIAKPLIQEFLSFPDVEASQKLEMEAVWAYFQGDYPLCVKLISEALALGNNDASALTIMGRALLKLKDYKNAALFLERAQLISPNNVQRLLDLSDARVGSDNLLGAKKALETASNLDASNEWVVMAECRVAIESGEMQSARSLLSELGSGTEIVAQMNNRAIALAQLGRVTESIGIYIKTLDALPVSWKSQIAKVTFNLGLAYTRNGEYGKAEQVLASVELAGEKDLSDKAKNLALRIKHAVSSGTKLVFQARDESELQLGGRDNQIVAGGSISGGSKRPIFVAPPIKPGDICLYRIFVDLEQLHDKQHDFANDANNTDGAKAS